MGGLKGVEDLVFDGFKFLVLGVAEAPRKGKIEDVEKADFDRADQIKKSPKQIEKSR